MKVELMLEKFDVDEIHVFLKHKDEDGEEHWVEMNNSPTIAKHEVEFYGRGKTYYFDFDLEYVLDNICRGNNSSTSRKIGENDE